MGIVEKATHRGRGRLAEDHPVRDRGERVHVGPRALLDPRHVGVLLDRRIARLEDGGQGLRHVADDAAGGAEVEQQRPAGVGQKQDVVGRDVAVVDLHRVQHRERVAHRPQQAEDPGLVGRRRHGPHDVAHRRTFEKRHHHVGGAVGLPEPVDLEQRRMVELGEQLGFVDEAFHAGVEGFPMSLRASPDLRRAGTVGDRRRHVLLERHLAIERMVPGQIDDSETTLADGRLHLELKQARSGGQGDRMVRRHCCRQRRLRDRRGVFRCDRDGRWRAGSGRTGARRTPRPDDGAVLFVLGVHGRWGEGCPKREPNRQARQPARVERDGSEVDLRGPTA